MSLWRSILSGFGMRIGSEIADKGLQKPPDETKKKKLIAVGIVGVSLVGLLFVSGILTKIITWVLGVLFLAGLGGGAWYLSKDRVAAFLTERKTKKQERVVEQVKEDKTKRAEDELQALKDKLGK